MSVVLGTVARVQVQRSRLKPGERGARRYDPSPIVEVERAQLGPRGVTGPDGALDVHHADHPDSRNVALTNGVSVLPRAHYAAIRARFGPHVLDGLAGETLLLDTDGPLTVADLAGDLLLETADGGAPLLLQQARAMPPCLEFSRWCLQQPGLDEGPALAQALEFLSEGRRGFALTAAGTGWVVAGARLRRA